MPIKPQGRTTVETNDEVLYPTVMIVHARLGRMLTSRVLRPAKIVIAATLVAALGLFAACGSSTNDPDGTESTGGPSQSSSPTESAGKTATLPGATFQVPADWDIQEEDGGLSMGAPGIDGGSSSGHAIFLAGSFPYAEPDANKTLASDEARRLDRSSVEKNVKRLPDVKLDGATFYHFQSEVDGGWHDWYGTIHNDSLVTVSWTFYKSDVNRKEATAFIDQVMPTFKSTS